MQAYRVETVVTQDGVLTLKGIPFRAGDKVEVIILSYPHKRKGEKPYPLRGKPVHYVAPFDSVAENEWEVMR